MINEIIDDYSTEKPKEETQKPSADILPKLSLNIVAENVPSSPSAEVVAELFKAHSDESQSRTKGDIVSYSDADNNSTKSDDEASIDNSIDEDDGTESDDNIKSQIKLLPASIDRLGKWL